MSYIRFMEQPPTGKTRIVAVVNTGTLLLGHIKWYSGFRKYTYHPVAGTLYDNVCLDEIKIKMEDMMKEYKNNATDNSSSTEG